MREDLHRQMTGVHSGDAPGTDILQLIERTRRVALHYTSGDHLCFERRRDNVLFESKQALWEATWFGAGDRLGYAICTYGEDYKRAEM